MIYGREMFLVFTNWMETIEHPLARSSGGWMLQQNDDRRLIDGMMEYAVTVKMTSEVCIRLRNV